MERKIDKPLHQRTFKYLQKSMSNLSLIFNSESKSSSNDEVVDDATLAQQFQNQYLQLLELEKQQRRTLNERLFLELISDNELTDKKKAPKSLKFLRIFRCSVKSKVNSKLSVNNCLVECQCCYDEIDLSETIMCENDHMFCRECVNKGTELAISNRQSFVQCFADCHDQIALDVLQTVIAPKTYEILMKKRQEEEIAAARLDFLETCPFCPYQMELDADVLTFYCQNPECMKVTCRSCKKIYHYDVKCEDVVDEHKGRLFIEEEMSEALIRKCYNCKKPFVIRDGCNKIQCSCGATMCYRCRQPITGYSHFDQTGGCKLHEDTENLDKMLVEQRRVKAIAKLRRDFPELEILNIRTE